MIGSLNKHASLFRMLIWLTLLAIAAQISFFSIYYQITSLVNDLAGSSIHLSELSFTILFPILSFIVIQIITYCLFVGFVWFITLSLEQLFNLSAVGVYSVGIATWFLSSAAILLLNHYYFPDSFFALSITHAFSVGSISTVRIVVIISCLILLMMAYINYFGYRRYSLLGSLFLGMMGGIAALALYTHLSERDFFAQDKTHDYPTSPNIILIGLDSVRPDFVNYFGKRVVDTPHIDYFLRKSVIFNQAYTSLARTFPSWSSILTAQHPLHDHARFNLANLATLLPRPTLATYLQHAGYETIYATDEKRFSNITPQFGFKKVLGPGMGINDFILGGLTDFPLTNLLINLPFGRIFFPYNYGNRAAAITYEPDNFLQLVKLGLIKRDPNKPLFLVVHLCVSHWPYTWARDNQKEDFTLAERYKSSVERVDKQLGDLLQILKEQGLLKHSLVGLLSDHGTTVGLPNDREVNEKGYRGDLPKMKWLPAFKLGSATSIDGVDFKEDFTINTSYGQGTDVLSLKQYHVLLAFKGFGMSIHPNTISSRVSLFDVAPTILDYLHLPALPRADGISLTACFTTNCLLPKRSLYLETGYTFSEIEKKDIFIDKVIHGAIGMYAIDKKTGLIFLKPQVAHAIVIDKQHAILKGNWLLAQYPAELTEKMRIGKDHRISFISNVNPRFFVLVNLATREWTVDFSSSFAKKAISDSLLQDLKNFYGNEIS